MRVISTFDVIQCADSKLTSGKVTCKALSVERGLHCISASIESILVINVSHADAIQLRASRSLSAWTMMKL